LTPEKLAALCTTFAVLLASGRLTGWRWLLPGAAVGMAILMKQPSGTALVPVLVLAVLNQRTQTAVRRAALVLLGCALPLAALAAIYAQQGALAAFVEYVLTINLERIATPASLGGFGG